MGYTTRPQLMQYSWALNVLSWCLWKRVAATRAAIKPTNIVNYIHLLQDLNVDEFESKPPYYTCASSTSIYNLTSLNIVMNTNLCEKQFQNTDEFSHRIMGLITERRRRYSFQDGLRLWDCWYKSELKKTWMDPGIHIFH